MALSTRETRGAHHRGEERHRGLAGCAVFKGIAIQTSFSRSLGNPARNVTAAQSCCGNHEVRAPKTKAGEIRELFPKTIVLSLSREASWIRSVCPDVFRLTRRGNRSRMRRVPHRRI